MSLLTYERIRLVPKMHKNSHFSTILSKLTEEENLECQIQAGGKQCKLKGIKWYGRYREKPGLMSKTEVYGSLVLHPYWLLST